MRLFVLLSLFVSVSAMAEEGVPVSCEVSNFKVVAKGFLKASQVRKLKRVQRIKFNGKKIRFSIGRRNLAKKGSEFEVSSAGWKVFNPYQPRPSEGIGGYFSKLEGNQPRGAWDVSYRLLMGPFKNRPYYKDAEVSIVAHFREQVMIRDVMYNQPTSRTVGTWEFSCDY